MTALKLLKLMFLYSTLTSSQSVRMFDEPKLLQALDIVSHVKREAAAEEPVAHINQFPYLAFIYYKGQNTKDNASVLYNCTGTVAAPGLVLTAAVCVWDAEGNSILNKDGFIVYTATINNLQPVHKSTVKMVFIHPMYNAAVFKSNCSINYDLAILELTKPLAFDLDTAAAILPQPVSLGDDLDQTLTSHYIEAGKECMLLGWKKYHRQDKSQSSPLLMRKKLHLVSVAKCKRLHAELASMYHSAALCEDSQLCTTDEVEHDAIAENEKGGPVVCDGMVVGVATYILVSAHLDGGKQYIDVFSRVDVFMDFVHHVMKTTMINLSVSVHIGSINLIIGCVSVLYNLYFIECNL